MQFKVLFRNLFLSRSDIRILASHKVAGFAVLESCPEWTLEKHVVSAVLSGRDVVPSLPATAWLANFRCRSATKEWFLQSMFNVPNFRSRLFRLSAQIHA